LHATGRPPCAKKVCSRRLVRSQAEALRRLFSLCVSTQAETHMLTVAGVAAIVTARKTSAYCGSGGDVDTLRKVVAGRNATPPKKSFISSDPNGCRLGGEKRGEEKGGACAP